MLIFENVKNLGKDVSKTIFIRCGEGFGRTKWSNQDYLKVVRDINTKISPVVNLYENPLCTKNQGHWCPKFGFPAKNV